MSFFEKIKTKIYVYQETRSLLWRIYQHLSTNNSNWLHVIKLRFVNNNQC